MLQQLVFPFDDALMRTFKLTGDSKKTSEDKQIVQ
jgi:hypothetical protein